MRLKVEPTAVDTVKCLLLVSLVLFSSYQAVEAGLGTYEATWSPSDLVLYWLVAARPWLEYSVPADPVIDCQLHLQLYAFDTQEC